jgi:hypothetical protein
MGPQINADNHFGTMRNSKVQDVQKAARPTNKPPPPPVPNRNIATNLTSQPHAKSTNALNHTSEQNLSAPRLPNSGSSNNITSMGRNATDAIDAPPLPPHRLNAKKPQQQTSVISNQAPEVPKRHSSIRTSIENGGGGGHRFPSPNPNQSVTRLVVDLEARYSLLFHSISEFPSPKPFVNVEKSYPSRASLRPTNGI